MDGFWDDLEEFGEDPFLDFPDTPEEMLGPYGWWEQQPQRPAYIWIPPAPQPTGTRGTLAEIWEAVKMLAFMIGFLLFVLWMLVAMSL
jgi:hypothetical protein